MNLQEILVHKKHYVPKGTGNFVFVFLEKWVGGGWIMKWTFNYIDTFETKLVISTTTYDTS